MDKISEDLFQYAFEVTESTIESFKLEEKDLIVIFSSLNVHKYFGKIDFGIEESYEKNAQMIIRDAVVYGQEPDFPSKVSDFSFVEDGSIYRNYIDYPFTAKGDLQFVITFYTGDKVTVRSNKVFMIINALDSNKHDIQ